ncbi:YCF48-related protein [Pseudomonas monteilii]|uniref:WD40/YVTN/BNR-like repeat-containing protein n=1 Tax=Pseudomonas TaxID=286 RepID=UPI00048E33A9|nr:MULTISPECIES: YCF48-related protein [Pseudomonas]MBA1315159.1 glycosyl hydrolase [Pseudomonas monteilii]MCE1017239.1 YCF48-related protein [Pseudomonas monteilii]MCE1033818.1 YCF48-related protein [Pseudomonas monteilii]MCE1085646.1 YCF48-related protein [Pseudomonas monteilii]MDH0021231.1 YCF48-related protein [Pseudomonas monteilii]
MSVFKRCSVVMLALAALQGTAQAVPFTDVLEVPAMPSALASSSALRDVTLAGPRLVAVGPRGHILYSDDHGAHWQQAQVPVSADLNGVSFATPELGWAVGHDGVVLHSRDGGVHWHKQLDGRALAEQLPAAATDNALLDVWFSDARNGYAVGVFNLLLRTTDGGEHWQPWLDHSDNPQGLHLTSLAAVGDDLYITGEQGLLLKWSGARFSRVDTPYAGTLFGAVGKPGVLLVYGLRGHAYRSTDGGQQWQPVNTGINTSLTAAGVDRNGQLWLASQAGDLLLSRDDGASFSQVPQSARGPVTALVSDTGNGLVLVGERGVRNQAGNPTQHP